MHYTVVVGPVKNSTAGLFSQECFTTEYVAREYGRNSLDKIQTGRNRLGTFECKQRETDDSGRHAVLSFNGTDTWFMRVRECTSEGCRVRVRLPITHK